MTNYYTGKGDKGTTSVMGGTSLPKDDALIGSIGEIDELNSQIGVALFYVRDEEMRKELKMIQNELFSIGAILASATNKQSTKAKIERKQIERLEQAIDSLGGRMPELKKFVLPAGSEEASHLHLARAIARRAERSVVAASKKYEIDENINAYLNRLSSFLFTAAIYLNFKNGIEESNPIY